jgi:hypothetical protein
MSMKTPKCSEPGTAGICFAKATQRVVTPNRITFRCDEHRLTATEDVRVFDLQEEAA